MKKSEIKEYQCEDKLTISDFLEFLKISCQLNKVISGEKQAEPDVIDFNKLSSNAIIENINEIAEQKKSAEATPGVTAKKGLHPILEEKLDNILQEGILDSIIPFICPMQLPLPNTQVKVLKTKHRDVSQSPRVGPFQPITSNGGKPKFDNTDSEKSIVVFQENSQRNNKRRKSSSSNITSDEKQNE